PCCANKGGAATANHVVVIDTTQLLGWNGRGRRPGTGTGPGHHTVPRKVYTTVRGRANRSTRPALQAIRPPAELWNEPPRPRPARRPPDPPFSRPALHLNDSTPC